MIPKPLKSKIEIINGFEILATNAVSGGDINRAYRLETTAGFYFLKINQTKLFPNMLRREADGLMLLAQKSLFKIPKVVSVFEEGEWQALLLEWIDSRKPILNFWESFGHKLGELHNNTQKDFGLEYNNYIGTLQQQNIPSSDWVEFFIEHRLEPLIKIARERGLMTSSESNELEALYGKLGNFFPKEKPSLLHGDLWNGNFMVNRDGHPTLIDPAAYYGHRYMDLGMMRLFGGFDERLYQAYNETSPLESNWRLGADIGSIYPLMVHVILFGRMYYQRINSVISRIV